MQSSVQVTDDSLFTYLTMFDGQFIEVVLNLEEVFDSIVLSS